MSVPGKHRGLDRVRRDAIAKARNPRCQGRIRFQCLQQGVVWHARAEGDQGAGLERVAFNRFDILRL